jgi:hypothetical protein
VTRQLQPAASFRTRAKLQWQENSPAAVPSISHPRRHRVISQADFTTAPARVRRRAVDPPPPRLLQAVSSAPPRPPRTRPALSTAPRPPPLASGTLRRRPCRRRAYFNMAHPRCSPVCSQGMRLHRPPTLFPLMYCLKSMLYC